MGTFQVIRDTSNQGFLSEIADEIPTTVWDNIGGLEKIKQELQEIARWPVNHPESFSTHGMSQCKGALLYGSSGAGKTLLANALAAECVANELNTNFICVPGIGLLTMRSGDYEANVRDVFNQARAAAPCILFFDDFDSIARQSECTSSIPCPGVKAQILKEMDSMESKMNLFILCASNGPHKIDSAFFRPGRLEHPMYVPLLDEPSRLSILRAFFKNSALPPDVDLSLLAKVTHGFSGADLTEICQRTVKLAIRESIQADIWEPREKAEKQEAESGDDSIPDEEDDIELELTAMHFEEAMKYARRSVGDRDIRRYEMFTQNFLNAVLNPNFEASDGPTGSSSAHATARGNAEFGEDVEDDNLYP